MPFIVLLHSSLAIFFSSPIEVKQEIKFVSEVCISLQITIELQNSASHFFNVELWIIKLAKWILFVMILEMGKWTFHQTSFIYIIIY